MKTLIENITNIYGNKGIAWFEQLPKIIEALTVYWQLKNIVPVDNMTYNYVARATTHQNHSVVLKISCDENMINDERHALKYFAGQGAIELLDYHDHYYAMLLHQAMPGITLKSLYPIKIEYVLEHYLAVVKKLHANHFDWKYKFNHISDWLKAIDKCNSTQIPQYLLNKARHLKNKLLNSSRNQILIHGDLHQNNILHDATQWFAIDPKGILGEPEFEIAAFDFIHENELQTNLAVDKFFEERIAVISQISSYDIQRIKDWVFVRLILAAVWCIEDKADPTFYIKLTQKMFPE